MYIKKKKINNSTIFDKTIIYRLWLARRFISCCSPALVQEWMDKGLVG